MRLPHALRGGPLRAGFALAPGSAGLIGARVAAAEIAALPVYVGAMLVLAGPASSPWFTGEPLDAERVARLGLLLPALLPAAAASLLLGTALAWVTEAAATFVLAPDRGAPRVLRALSREGPAELWAMLRTAAIVALPASLLLWAIAAGAALADRALERAGVTAVTAVVTLPATALLLALLVLAIVAALATWTRVITLLDGRKRARRSALIALAAFRARPAAPLLFVLATGAARALSVLLLVAWRRADPFLGGTTPLFLAAALAAASLQAFAWHGLLRGAVLTWTSPQLAALRGRPDAPLGILRARVWAAAVEDSPAGPDPA